VTRRSKNGEVEPCINGAVLALGGYFGEASDRLLDRLLGEQLEDGGWNCEAPESRRSSFHTTICVLEGLLEYEKSKGATAAVFEARVRARSISWSAVCSDPSRPAR
jgi:squalene cyclase